MYELIVGSPSRLAQTVRGFLADGWVLHGSPFRTGNRLLISGDPAYPVSCEYTNELAQAVHKGNAEAEED